MAISEVIPFKDDAGEAIKRYLCLKCTQVLRDAVQLGCGHRLCKLCADELIATESTPKCVECEEDIMEEDGAKVLK